jgi:two-component system, OmpR family, response regulator
MCTLQKILYVEDEPDIQAVAKVALEMVGGFTLKICSSGQEALESAEDFLPDLILLDVMMPGMDGLTTMRKLRDLPGMAAVPVVFMTAKVQPNEIQEYLAQGAKGVIAKPFDPMKLGEEVQAIWEQGHG